MTDQIDEIMDYFDFEEVHTAMQALGWTWVNKGIPSTAEIRQQARGMLKAVASGKEWCASTGGLRATNQDGILSLEFILTHWETELPKGK